MMITLNLMDEEVTRKPYHRHPQQHLRVPLTISAPKPRSDQTLKQSPDLPRILAQISLSPLLATIPREY